MLNDDGLLIAGICFAIGIDDSPSVPSTYFTIGIGLLDGAANGYVGTFIGVPCIDYSDAEVAALGQHGIGGHIECARCMTAIENEFAILVQLKWAGE